MFRAPSETASRKRTFLDANGNDVPLSYYYKSMYQAADINNGVCILRVP